MPGRGEGEGAFMPTREELQITDVILSRFVFLASFPLTCKSKETKSLHITTIFDTHSQHLRTVVRDQVLHQAPAEISVMLQKTFEDDILSDSTASRKRFPRRVEKMLTTKITRETFVTSWGYDTMAKCA